MLTLYAVHSMFVNFFYISTFYLTPVASSLVPLAFDSSSTSTSKNSHLANVSFRSFGFVLWIRDEESVNPCRRMCVCLCPFWERCLHLVRHPEPNLVCVCLVSASGDESVRNSDRKEHML